MGVAVVRKPVQRGHSRYDTTLLQKRLPCSGSALQADAHTLDGKLSVRVDVSCSGGADRLLLRELLLSTVCATRKVAPPA